MSTLGGLLGREGEPLSLGRARTLLAESARQAGRPCWPWVAGVFYPGLSVTQVVLDQLAMRGPGLPLPWWPVDGPQSHQQWLGMLVLLLPLWLLIARLWAGLARIAEPGTWDAARGERPAPGLLQLWRAGRGLTISALGLWLAKLGLTLGAFALVLAPVYALAEVTGGSQGRNALLLVLAPLWLLLLAYLLVLEVVNQLGLQSLARNRRGTASAVIHAWRLMRAHPWAVVRAISMDMVLQAVSLAAILVLAVLSIPTFGLGLVLLLPLLGVVGSIRAAFWARCYGELGGLSVERGPAGEAGRATAGVQ
jgi:hypothetical protein